jgi:transcriptional regulator with XRE-family HTH domain
MRGSLAERLRVLRAQRGLTLAEASKMIGVNRHTLRDLELGKREPYGPTLRKIAEGYGTTVSALLTEAEPVPLGEAPVLEGQDVLEMDAKQLENLRVRAREDYAQFRALRDAQEASLKYRVAAERATVELPEDLGKIKQRDRILFKLYQVVWYERNRAAINADERRSPAAPIYPDTEDLSLDDAFVEMQMHASSKAGV